MAKKPLPQFIEPMMASVVRDPFDNTDWIFETSSTAFAQSRLLTLPARLEFGPAIGYRWKQSSRWFWMWSIN
jgi:hypothetical protein